MDNKKFKITANTDLNSNKSVQKLNLTHNTLSKHQNAFKNLSFFFTLKRPDQIGTTTRFFNLPKSKTRKLITHLSHNQHSDLIIRITCKAITFKTKA